MGTLYLWVEDKLLCPLEDKVECPGIPGGLNFPYCISDSRHYIGCLLLFILSCLSGFLLPNLIASYEITASFGEL